MHRCHSFECVNFISCILGVTDTDNRRISMGEWEAGWVQLRRYGFCALAGLDASNYKRKFAEMDSDGLVETIQLRVPPFRFFIFSVYLLHRVRCSFKGGVGT